MRSRKAAAVLITVGCLFLAAAITLGGYNLWDDARAGRSIRATLDRLISQEDSASDSRNPPDPDMEMPVVEIDGRLYIGTVSVPSLDLELPVLESWSYPNLKIAPCRYAGTAYRPGFVLCAHNYTSHFGRLKNLSPGDRVLFTDTAGNAFSYEVAVVETLAPTAVEEMKSSDWDLTLFSCTIGGECRINRTDSALS